MSDEQVVFESTDSLTVIQDIVRTAVREVLLEQKGPDIDSLLEQERSNRSVLEQKIQELMEENNRSRAKAEEVDREMFARTELQKLGVAKIDLAFRAVKDILHRNESGNIVAKTSSGESTLTDYLKQFLAENPELLPARIPGGSGMNSLQRNAAKEMSVNLDRIGPGMGADELERARKEIVRVAAEAFRGQR